MTGGFDPFLVALSLAVAMAASYMSLEFARRSSQSEGLAANSWMAAGSTVMGSGIWVTQFVGMLAVGVEQPFTYGVMLTVASLVVGTGSSWFSIYVATRRFVNNVKVIPSSLILGAGIVSMHYIGMASLRTDGSFRYDLMLVTASACLAVIVSGVAIWITINIAKSTNATHYWQKLVAAAVMACAICGMHYTGVLAATYIPNEVANVVYAQAEKLTWITVGIGLLALTVLGVTHLMIVFNYQVSAQRKISAAAKKSALQLNKILDDSSNEIFIVDSETLNILSANKGAIENLGYEKEVLERMTLCAINSEFDDDKIKEKVQVLRDGIRNMLVFNSAHKRADGTVYPVHVSLQLHATSDDAKTELVAIITNITERVNFEAQIEQSMRLQSIGQLAAGIAHEINTPAQYVGDNIRFLKDAFEDLKVLSEASKALYIAAQKGQIQPDDIERVTAAIDVADPDYLYEEMPTAIEQSLDGITRISKIVRAMKEFSHPGSVDKELIDLNKNIANTIIVASNEWKYAAQIEVDYKDELPLVPCHPQEISQVVLNLIVNASHSIADKNKDDSGQLGKIKVATYQREKAVEIRVADSGMGIPDSIRSRIFDPFFTTKGVGKGTGQGLSMAYVTIVEKHSGTIRVESEEGVGTTFIISLPITDNAKSLDVEAA
ncbi:MAG: MHYT domain-containing protein [Gammaproteobacteria bacterium]